MVSLAILCICRCHYHLFPAEFLMAKPFCLTAAKTTWHFHGRWLGRFQVARQSGPDASVMWMSNFHETIIAMDMPLIQETTIFWIFETDFLDDQRVSLKTKILGGETFTTSKSLSCLHIFLQICGSMLQGEPGTTNLKENITTDFDIRKTLCLINIIQSYPINITSGYMSNWLRFIEQAHGKIRGRVQLWVTD